ncbi:50S ribosomal protein L11 methyltransferase [Liberibacter crescens]|uniref:50S ribosomal protein L11 methyltransferase n=1 Tax=Liberibacter crescens TaxID=1273132 RepID=UPI000762FD8C|nr:50S ribosomal protein L11 methyltransferase [Liberibacter crescens]AMC12788.1 hypothetical protein RL73_03580 [Liberibacter crescens]
MSEIRLYIQDKKKRVEEFFELLSCSFWESHYAISTVEINEKSDISEISLYVNSHEESDIRTRLVSLLQDINFNGLIHKEILPEIDWISKSISELKPIHVGRFIIHGAHDRHNVINAHNFTIEIEANQAFGTGHHETTVGCLEFIDQLTRLRTFKNALDLGTGSGILAIAIAKSAKISVFGVDSDPIAIRIAQENAVLNHVSLKTSFDVSTNFEARTFHRKSKFDLIVANILADPLIKIAPQLVRHLNPKGFVILSGILDSQCWKVIASYRREGMIYRRMILNNGWVTLLFKKKDTL